MQILTKPKLLMLVLKRYEFDSRTKRMTKDKRAVNCPKKLVLPCGSFLRIKAIINHYGDSPSSGHYTALLWDDKHDIFVHVNDTKVEMFQQIPQEMSGCNYIVIYHTS